MALELSAVKFFTGIIGRLFDLRIERKKALAKYFTDIADVLTQFGPAYQEKDYSKMALLTSQTRTLAANFKDIVGTLVDGDTFASYLEKAANDKEIISKEGTGEDQKLLNELSEIAGIFRATAMGLEATASRPGH